MKKYPLPSAKFFAASAAAVFLAASLPVHAQTVRTWDGDTDSDNSGLWSVPENWSGNNVPDTSTERAFLDSVTTGTRTVTNDAAHSIHSLHMTQSNGTGINRLLLDANLTLATPTGATEFSFVLSGGAGVDNLVVDLNGQTITMSRNQFKTTDLRGTWDFTTSGSLLRSTGGSDRLTIQNDGLLKMGAGSEIDIARASGQDYFINLGQVRFEGAGISQIGRTTDVESGTFHIGGSSTTGATFTVGDGTDTPTARLRQGSVFMTNFAGNTVTVNEGGTLELLTTRSSTDQWQTKQTRITNHGDLEHSGKVLLRPNSWNLTFAADNRDIINSGTWTVSGQNAVVERGMASTAHSHEDSLFRIENEASGVFQGDGKMTYTNTTGRASLNTAIFTNAGLISPGAGEGMTGTLELLNTNVVFAEGGELRIEIGGTQAGEFDLFKIDGGTYGGVLDLSAADTTLTIVFSDGFSASAGTWVVANVASRIGDFANANFSSSQFTYEWDGGDLVVSAIPEPSAMAAIAGLFALGLVAVRRRRS